VVAQSLKSKKLSSQAVFARQTIQSNLLEGIIEIPSNLKNRLVQIILLPLGRKKYSHKRNKRAGSPRERFAGAWVGKQLVREDQGD
jgi:hypothetical protein